MANEKVLTQEGRIRWVNVFQARADMNGKMKKSICLLIPKKSSIASLTSAWEKLAKEEFKGKVPGSLRRITGGQKPILKDGDEVYATRDEDKQEAYECYRDCWVLQPSCNENDPLRILGPDASDLIDPAELYDGCYGQIVINISVYQSKAKPGYVGGPMCSVTLLGVRKTRDGEPIEGGGGAKLTDDDLNRFFGGQQQTYEEEF
jgi:hypothetical protein